MLNSKTVVEQLFKSAVTQFLLVLHFDLQQLAFLNVRVTDHVLCQVDFFEAGVFFQRLS
jgi:hypothetical protein